MNFNFWTYLWWLLLLVYRRKREHLENAKWLDVTYNSAQAEWYILGYVHSLLDSSDRVNDYTIGPYMKFWILNSQLCLICRWSLVALGRLPKQLCLGFQLVLCINLKLINIVQYILYIIKDNEMKNTGNGNQRCCFVSTRTLIDYNVREVTGVEFGKFKASWQTASS